MDDNELRSRVSTTMRGNRNIGPNAVRASLIGMGVVVQRRRIRQAMRTVDPTGAALRSVRAPVTRRTYSVAGPNSLWHIDGNHRLIR